MANDSTTAGFIAPTQSPVYDNALDKVFHDAIAGITGIPGSLVRPRWQPEPPQQPAFDVNWVAFGIVDNSVDTFAYDHHSPSDETSQVQRDEVLQVLHSFYGPDATQFCERFRDGLEIAQNRDQLQSAGVFVQEVQQARQIPALLKERWVKRVDALVVYRRRTSRSYKIANIVSAELTVLDEGRDISVIVNQ